MPANVRINNRYEIRSSIGQGGMGVVYRAWDYVTKRDVALKTLRDIADPAAIELFAKEWTVLAGLSHPNIVDILDTGEFEENGRRKPYFVMPLLPGTTLDKLIRSASQRLTVNRAVEILVQTCRGLQAAHERGLVHRDLKPSNIFVMEDDAAKIIDFGVVHLTGSHSVTGIKGTLQYMAPEQLELQPATPLSDIFSLGVVGYEALTGRKPFARQTEGDTADAVRKFIPPPASDINPAVSQTISRVMHKAMAKQPWHRFATAREFADTLQKALHNQPIEMFDQSKIKPRIERSKKAFNEGDLQFATEILSELEAEGHIDPDMGILRMQIDQAARKKAVRQLLESARTRFEQEEFPLALQKIQEVLRIDPDNADALGLKADIENRRSERQVENWFSLVRAHMGRNAFSEARQALDEILKISPRDTRALQLRTEVEQKEQDAIRVRNEKEQLYTAARAAFQNGEISTAMSRLERVLKLNREVPDRVVPDRDALYQSLYNQVRSEYDAIRMAYEEGRRALTEQNFPRALEFCDQYLNKYPGHPLFQALKLEAGEMQRQQLSLFVAETGKRVDMEPDLERKIAILKEAVEKCPSERQFQESLKLTRERRDLVNSIVAKARQYEERSQFSEAIGQWEILRSIYVQYPGLAFEVDQLERRREQQSQEEARGRWTEQIDRALEAGKHERALDLTNKALEEFPGDTELANLAAMARQGLERSAEARKLFEEGQRLCTATQYAEGVEQLRKAAALDERDDAIAQALANALVEQARGLVESDWKTADNLIDQALSQDTTNVAAKSLRALIIDRKRREFVDEVVQRARQLQLDGKLEDALEHVDRALTTYQGEARLMQLQSTFRNSLTASSRIPTRAGCVKQLRELSNRAASTTDPRQLRAVLEQSRIISQHYPEDPEIRSMAAQVEQQVATPKTPERSNISTLPPQAQAARAASVAGPALPPEAAETMLEPLALDRPDPGVEQSETAVLPIASPPASVAPPLPAQTAPPWTPPPPPPLPVPPQAPPPRAQQPSAPGGPPRKSSLLLISAGLVVLLALAAGTLFLVRRPKPAPPSPAAAPVQQYPVQIDASVPGAVIRIDGQPAQPGSVPLKAGKHTVDATLEGYKPVSQQIDAGPNAQPVQLTLEPELERLRITTSLETGKVFLDDTAAVDLQDGSFWNDGIALTEHKLRVTGRMGDVLSIVFTAAPAKLALLNEPLKSPDIAVVSTLGSNAIVYCGTPSCQAGLKDQPLKPVPTEGLSLSDVGANADLVLSDGKNTHNLTIESTNAPVLVVYATTNENIGTVRITSNVPDAQVLIDGQAQKRGLRNGRWSRKLPPGTYAFRVTKDGYDQADEQKIDLAKGDTKALNFDLKPTVVTATLEIDGGTPNADVWVDGSRAGTLNASGSFTHEVSPGMHDIELRKDGFETAALARRAFTAGRQTHISSADARLKAFGTLAFQISPGEAIIEYHREGDPATHEARNNAAVNVPAGQYVISVSAPKHDGQEETVEVDSGKTARVALTLVATRTGNTGAAAHTGGTGAFEMPDAWQQQNGWWFHKGASYAWLKATRGAFSIDIQRKGGGIFGGGKIEFQAGYIDERNRVTYQLDEHKLVRRAFSGGKKNEHTTPLSMSGDVYRLRLDVETSKVTLRDGQGILLDEYEDPSEDFTAGKIGFKGDIRLVVR